MKKLSIVLTVVIAALLMNISCYSQKSIKGIDWESAESFLESDESEYEVLLVNPEGTTYWIFYQNTAVGYKHLIDRILNILSENDLDFSKPTYDISLIPFYAENIFDYSSMSTGINSGEGEIKKGWSTEDYIIWLMATQDDYMISFRFK
ncbi:hypothetical protein ES705_24547 [subsurface metagenome]